MKLLKHTGKIALLLVLGANANSAMAECKNSESGHNRTKLCVGKSLSAGQYIKSPNGSYKLHMQGDGNLVLRNSNGSVRWESKKNGIGNSKLWVQGDGNVVTRRASGGSATWSTGTHGRGEISHLSVTNNGNLVVNCMNNNVIYNHLKGIVAPKCTSYDLMDEYGAAGNLFNKSSMTHHKWDTSYGADKYDLLGVSKYFTCQEVGECGQVTLETGTEICKTTKIDIGFSFSLPTPPGFEGVKIGKTTTSSYQACSTKNEATTCYNTQNGYKVRAETRMRKRWGTKKVTGKMDNYFAGYTQNGGRICSLGGYPANGGHTCSTFYNQPTRTIYRTGYWPNEADTTCSPPIPNET